MDTNTLIEYNNILSLIHNLNNSSITVLTEKERSFIAYTISQNPLGSAELIKQSKIDEIFDDYGSQKNHLMNIITETITKRRTRNKDEICEQLSKEVKYQSNVSEAHQVISAFYLSLNSLIENRPASQYRTIIHRHLSEFIGAIDAFALIVGTHDIESILDSISTQTGIPL